MLAIRLHEYGDVDVMGLEEAPRPFPAPGEVLVRVRATAVNPIDWRIRNGSAHLRLPLSFPIIPGVDFAGTVEEISSDVDDWSPGDEVYGSCGVRQNGAYSQYVSIAAGLIARRPRSIKMEEAAGVPTAAVTAYATLFDFAKLQPGQSVLIQGAAGGVGAMAVQLAKRAGAIVYATCSASSTDLVQSLGADIVIDYHTTRFEEVARDLDVVFDGVGGETLIRSFESLKPGGYMAAIVDPPNPSMLAKFGVRGERCHGRLDGALLATISHMIDAGQLRTVIDRVMPLDEVRMAHRLSEAGHSHGKIILLVP